MTLPSNIADREHKKFLEDSNGNVAVRSSNVETAQLISSLSTTTPLDADEVFAGTDEDWIDVSSYPSLVVSAKADQDGTMYMEFSHNASTNDSSISFPVYANVNNVHRLTRTRQYYRTRFVNGSVAQTSFNLTTFAGEHAALTAPSNISLSQAADATVVRVIEQASDISEGKRTGLSNIRKFGRHADVDAAGYAISYGVTGNYAGFPTSAAENLVLVSSDANDTSGGTGARTVRIFYLDSNYEMQTVDVNMNGTTPVNAGVSGVRSYRGIVLTSGGTNNANFNAGTITCRWETTTSVVFWQIPPSTGQTQTATYTIPAGYTGYFISWDVEMARSANATAEVGVYVKEFGLPPTIRYPKSISQSDSIYKVFHHGYDRLPEKTDISLRVVSISTTNIGMTGEFLIRLVKN